MTIWVLYLCCRRRWGMASGWCSCCGIGWGAGIGWVAGIGWGAGMVLS